METSSEATTGYSKHPTSERDGNSETEVKRGRLTLKGRDVTREPPW